MADKPVLIWAVVVVYNPERHALTRLFESLELQVEGIVVVDNTPSDVREQSPLPTCSCTCAYVHMGGNAGVAKALNQGCCRAIQGGATHVLLMDQDSVPDSGMLPLLLASLEKADKAGKNVAAAAPRYRDALATGSLSRFVRIRWGRAMLLPTDADVVDPDFVVSSGMLIATRSLRRIGPMDPVLFIDHVDTEWCLRARELGYCFCGVNDAYMTHRLGDTRIELWPRWRGELVVHAPERYYFMVRNGLLIQKRHYVTMQWRVLETKRLLYLFIVYGLLLPSRAKRLYWMWRGLLDGVAGVSGGLPE
jgi:rhamnosyltransferase